MKKSSERVISYHLQSISRSRAFILGLATLWVMLYHSRIQFTRLDGPGFNHFLYILDYLIYQVKTIGQIGVDVFLFLSGIGLYYSLEKDENVVSFYKRRFTRILPEYVFVNVLWGLINGFSIDLIIKNIIGISFFKNGFLGNWFFVLIITLYIVYPLIHKFTKKNDYLNLILIVFLILLNLFLSQNYSSLFNNIEIALRRVPIFIFGSFAAKYIKENKQLSIMAVLCAIIICVLSKGYLLDNAYIVGPLYRYLGSIFGLCVVVVSSFLYDLIVEKMHGRELVKLIEMTGLYSMESYLLYEKTIVLFNYLLSNNLTIALLSFVVCFILAFLLRRFGLFFNKTFLK